RALIFAPTRELAEQIADNIKAYTKYTNLSVAAIFGGRKMSSQERMLENGVDILVATPGRLEEHIESGNVSVANIEFLVFDEADRILDM
ncbi:DEAD/DEAH box helicase, partial [Staphylococcus aureus]|nr:DEAD/DEAH box helicase [Staphylococcus aureus]